MTENQTKSPDKFIDIDGVIKDKNPSLYQIIPGFLIRYVSERIVRERVLNQILLAKKISAPSLETPQRKNIGNRRRQF